MQPTTRPSLLLAVIAVLAAAPAAARPALPSGPGKTFQAPDATIWYEVRGNASGRPLARVVEGFLGRP